MADIFKLVGSIFVDTDKANDSLSKTDKKAGSVGETLAKVGSTAAKAGTAIVTGATAAVGGIVSLASSTAKTADEIDKASIRMGISAESYQEYAYAAELAGVETSTLEKAAKKLEGTDISFDDAIDQIMSMSTAEERSAKAAELFGDAVAYNLSPMIEQSQESFKGAIDEANKLGLVMSGDDVKAGAELNDTFTKITETFQHLVTSLGSSVLPIVQEFADMLLEYTPMIQGFMEQMSPILQEMFSHLVPPLMELVQTILPIVLDLVQQIMPFLVEIISMVLPVIVDLITQLSPILKPIIESLTPILQLVITILDPLLKLINVLLPPLIKLLIWVTDTALKPLNAMVNKTSEVFKVFVTTIKNVFDKIKPAVKGPVNAVLGFINGLIRGVTGGINSVIRALNRLHINVPSWVTKLTGVSSFGFNLAEVSAPQIPLLAKGGLLESGSAIVGEDGPELLQTNGKQTKVTPLNDNNNEFVELNKKLDRLITLMENGMGVYINGGALVGQIAPEIDRSLGRLSVKNSRGVYA